MCVCVCVCACSSFIWVNGTAVCYSSNANLISGDVHWSDKSNGNVIAFAIDTGIYASGL